MTNWQEAIDALNSDQIICHATEGVFGLACRADSQLACDRMVTLKQRPSSKGFIILPRDLAQISDWIEPLSDKDLNLLESSWPGHITFLIKKSRNCPTWLASEFDTIAVRISPHPQIQELLRTIDYPICSTSANLSGQPTVNSLIQAKRLFPQIVILNGTTLGLEKPSQIFDLVSGQQLR